MWQNTIVMIVVSLAAWHLFSTILGTLRSTGNNCGGCAKGCSTEPELMTIQPLGKDSTHAAGR